MTEKILKKLEKDAAPDDNIGNLKISDSTDELAKHGIVNKKLDAVETFKNCDIVLI